MKLQLKVLVVDDEGAIADTLALVLKSRAFSAEAVHSGPEAIARARSAPFDVLISDVIMPEMNGIEAAKAVCEILPDCRTILISGNPAAEPILAAAREQGHEYEIYAKPAHPSVFIRILEEMQEQSEN